MLEFFSKLFDTSDFPARWHCGLWSEGHGWLHIISDSAIFAAYAAIPAILVYFVRRRSDVPFSPIFLLFGSFILLCGGAHLVEATMFWMPWYRLSGLIKLLTAVVSWLTVIALVRITPKALALPGVARVNEQLRHEISARAAVQAELARGNACLKSKQLALERANVELEQFAYAASHDLKAPLRAIDHLSGWIKKDCGDSMPTETLVHLEQMCQRTRRMSALLDDLLEYSRVGRIEDSVEDVDIETLVQDIVEIVAPPSEFEVEFTGEALVATLPRAALQRVLHNLVDNAIKHHDRPNGRVEVAVARRGPSCLHLEVRDDGPGIEPRYQQKVFEIFKTLKSRDEVEGSGIGLSVVKKSIERLGGSITVSSQGRGTCFSIELPLLSELRAPEGEIQPHA